MYISNDDSQNYPFCWCIILVGRTGYFYFEPTNQDLITVPKVFLSKQMWETLSRSIIYNPISPPSLYLHQEDAYII